MAKRKTPRKHKGSGLSAYLTSKTPQGKIIESYLVECPGNERVGSGIIVDTRKKGIRVLVDLFSRDGKPQTITATGFSSFSDARNWLKAQVKSVPCPRV